MTSGLNNGIGFHLPVHIKPSGLEKTASGDKIYRKKESRGHWVTFCKNTQPPDNDKVSGG